MEGTLQNLKPTTWSAVKQRILGHSDGATSVAPRADNDQFPN
jgi:hypothetical protein